MTLPLPEDIDLLIVGAGPAGLAAAAELAPHCRVLVVEREAQAGGIPRHCAHSPFGMREFHRVLGGAAYAKRLVLRAESAGARIATRVNVTALHAGPCVDVTSDAGVQRIHAKRVLLATGVREASRAQRLIGGEKPGGIIPTGALQGMVHLEGRLPFRRPVILGTELVALSAVLTCLGNGIRPVAVIEPGSRQNLRFPFTFFLRFCRLLGLPLMLGSSIRAIEGRERVERVLLDTPGGRKTLDCDGVLLTGDFRPEAALLKGGHLLHDPCTGGPVIDSAGRLSDPAYYAAGNLLRPVETAGWSWEEGRRAAAAIRADLAGSPAGPARPVTLRGEALAWVVPQSVTEGGVHRVLQLRVNRPVRGRLRLVIGGVEAASRRIDSRPGRRITLPLPQRPGPVEVVLEER